MYGLVVRFDLKDEESAEAFDRLVAETSERIRTHEPGTLTYVPHLVVGEPLARVFYEMYQDCAAFEAHERQPHTQHFLGEREKYIADTRVEFLSPLAAAPKATGAYS